MKQRDVSDDSSRRSYRDFERIERFAGIKIGRSQLTGVSRLLAREVCEVRSGMFELEGGRVEQLSSDVL